MRFSRLVQMWSLGITAALAGAGFAQTVDGTRDASYGFPKVWQTVQTGFGSSNTGSISNANGSELVAGYGTISGGRLRLFFSGNLETNTNRLWIFIDSIAGGQNRLRGDNVGFASLTRQGDSGGPNGVIFDTGFDPDFVFSINANTSTVFTDFSSLPTSSGGTGVFVGQSSFGSGTLSGGSNLLLQAEATINNSSTTGVTGTMTPSSGQIPDEVGTGIELSVNAAALGITGGGPVKVFAYITSSDGSFLSNQFLPDVGANGAAVGNFGEPRGINFNSSPGTQYFFVHGLDNGRVVALRANGTTNAAASIDLLEFNKTGTGQSPLSSLSIPSASTPRVTMSGSATSEGQLTRSVDGQLLTLQGYDEAVGVANVASGTTSRRVAGVSRTGAVNVDSLPQGLGGNNVRGSILFGDNRLFVSGAAAGVQAMTYGANTSTSVSNGMANTRFVNIANNRLQFSINSGSNVGVFGFNVLPSSLLTGTLAVNSGTGTYDFAQVGPRLLYTCDEASASGGVRRYVNSGGAWTLEYTISFGTSGAAGARSIVAERDPATGQPVLYVISADASSNRIIRVQDTGTKAGAEATIQVLSTSGSSAIFRGVELSHLPINAAPTAVGDSYSSNEDTPLSIAAPGVLGNDTDDGQVSPLTAVLVAAMPASEGTVVLNANGSFTFTPAANFSGTTSFTYKANDGALDSSTVTVTISVVAVNDDPILGAIGAQTVNEGQLLSLTLASNDFDGGAPVYFMSGQPTGATLLGNVFSWTPTEAQGPGSYNITFSVSDGNGGTDSEVVNVTVNEVNEAPVLDAVGAQTLPELAAFTFDANATDNDDPAQTLTFSLTGQPAGMTIDGVTGVISWTPTEAQGPGSYTFTVKVSDGTAEDTELVTWTVDEVNEAPVLNAVGNQTVDELQALSITLGATDADVPAQTLTYSATGLPAGATLVGNVFSWTPTEAQGPGTYSVTFAVSDGTDTDTETITITVSEVNEAPVLGSVGAQTLDELAAFTFDANATDNDDPAQTLTFSLTGQPAGMTIDGVTGVISWTPTEAQGPGSYTFTVKGSDGTAEDTELVTWTVDEVNVAPTANAQSVTTAEDTSVGITLTGSDSDLPAQTLSYTVVGTPSFGTLSGTAPNLTYTPNANFNGSDSFTFKVNDGTADSAVATVNITVTAVADMVMEVVGAPAPNFFGSPSWPGWRANALSGMEGGVVNVGDRSTDPTGFEIVSTIPWRDAVVSNFPSWRGVAGPSAPFASELGNRLHFPVVVKGNGTRFSLSQLDYTLSSSDPGDDLGFTGSFLNSDVYGSSRKGIDYGPDRVKGGGDDIIYMSGQPATLLVDELVYAGIGNAWDASFETGTSQEKLNSVRCYLEPLAPIDITMTYKIRDGLGGFLVEDTAVVTLVPTNTLPVANNQSVTTDEDTAVNITLSATDVDAEPLTYTVVDAPVNGVLSGTAPNLTYTPSANFSGVDTFTFKATDCVGDSNLATVTITVNGVNDAPELGAIGNQSVNEGSLLSLTLTSLDIDGGAPVYSASGLPAGATLVGNVFSWTPSETQGPGTYSVTFSVNDGNGGTDSETITITVSEVNEAPVLNAVGNQSVDELQPLSLTLGATDADEPAQTLTYSASGLPAGATFSGNTFSWTPTEAQGPGTYSVTFSVSDGTDTDTETITITVNEVNEAPVLAAVGAQTLDELAAFTFDANATDNDDPAQTLTFSLVGAPAGMSINGVTGVISWAPTEAQGPGSYTFTVKVSDGTAEDEEILTWTVSEVNVAPTANAQSVTTAEETGVNITLTGSDSDLPTQTLTYTVVGSPVHGVLGGTAPNLSYTPNANFAGTDTFTFKVNDGTVDSALATVTITVTDVVDVDVQVIGSVAPNIFGSPSWLAYTVKAMNSLENTPGVDDGDRTLDPTAYDVVTSIPWYDNSVTGTPFWLNVQNPAAPFGGELGHRVHFGLAVKGNGTRFSLSQMDFEWTSSDGNALGFTDSWSGADVYSPRRRGIDFGPDRLKGTGDDIIYINNEPASLEVDELYYIGYGNAYDVTQAPGSTVAEKLASTRCYIEENAPIVMTGTYKFRDGLGGYFASGTGTVTIVPTNVLPVANSQSVTTDEDTAVNITLTATDSDPFEIPLTYTVVGAPAHGVLSGTAPNLIYTPNANFSGTDTFTFKATDCVGDSNLATVTITVNGVNDAPELGAIGNQSVAEGSLLSITLNSVDLDGGSPVYSSSALPAGASLSGNTFSWTPSEAQGPGVYSITFSVNDGNGGTDSETITITVTEVNEAPVLNAIGDQTVDELQPLSLTLGATDADEPAQTLTYSASGLPAGATLSGNTFSWTPTEAQGPGTYSATFSVSDGTDTDTETITITVNEVNEAPVLATVGSQSVNELNTLAFTLSATDGDEPAQTLTYSATGLPAGATLTGNSFSWTPTEAQGPGTYSITFTVNDGNGGTDSETISITVDEVNQAPVLNAIGDQSIPELAPFSLALGATDADLPDQTLTYSATGLPAGATLVGNLLSWTPTEAQGPGSYTITVTVDDANGGTDSETLTITVSEVNENPVLGAIGDQTVDELQPLSLTLGATDGDEPAQTLTYSASGLPAGATLTGNSFSWTPTEAQGPGTYSITFTVGDGAGGTDSETITITVNEVNQAPVLDAIGSQSVDELQALTFTASATDLDEPAQTLTYSLVGAPAGATINPTTGAFTWTPTEAQGAGTYTFKVKVSDGTTSDEEEITVTVNEVNVAPEMDTISNQSATEDVVLNFSITASDPDVPVQTLSYSLTGAPSGVTVNPTTGVVTWTPSESQGGASYTFDLVVSDGSLTDTQSITVTVAEDNKAPILNAIGSQSVNELQLLTFTATATDADLPVQTLTYSLVGAPAGASINPTTGVFTWTPTVAQGPGTYTFDVKVSDGTLEDTETITVTVNAIPTNVSGVVTLENFNPGPFGTPVTIEFRQGGVVVDTKSAVLNPIGAFTVSTMVTGVTDVTVKASHWLAKAFTVDIQPTSVTGLSWSLRNGDINGDNEVGASDFSLLAAAYDSYFGDANYNYEADLNGDGEVGAADFSILAASYDEVGDPWGP